MLSACASSAESRTTIPTTPEEAINGAPDVPGLTNAPSMIRKFAFTIPRDQALAFGRARLRISWDGRKEPSVDAPIALFFAIASLGLPGLGNFVGEFLILLGTWKVAPVITCFAASGLDEYFAESMRAYVEINDERCAWLPLTRHELQARDPRMFALIERLFTSGFSATERRSRRR